MRCCTLKWLGPPSSSVRVMAQRAPSFQQPVEALAPVQGCHTSGLPLPGTEQRGLTCSYKWWNETERTKYYAKLQLKKKKSQFCVSFVICSSHERCFLSLSFNALFPSLLLGPNDKGSLSATAVRLCKSTRRKTHRRHRRHQQHAGT